MAQECCQHKEGFDVNINWHTFWSSIGTMFGILVVIGGILYGYMEAKISTKVDEKLKVLTQEIDLKYVARGVCSNMHENSTGEMREFKEDMKRAIDSLGKKVDTLSDHFIRIGARAIFSLEHKESKLDVY